MLGEIRRPHGWMRMVGGGGALGGGMFWIQPASDTLGVVQVSLPATTSHPEQVPEFQCIGITLLSFGSENTMVF